MKKLKLTAFGKKRYSDIITKLKSMKHKQIDCYISNHKKMYEIIFFQLKIHHDHLIPDIIF